MLADQMLERIMYIHEKGILHRDLHPANMSVGLDVVNGAHLYIIGRLNC